MLINLFYFFMIIICFFVFLIFFTWVFIFKVPLKSQQSRQIDKKNISFIFASLSRNCMFLALLFWGQNLIKSVHRHEFCSNIFSARLSRFKTIYFCRLYVQRLTQVNSYQYINQKWFKSLISQLGLYIR